MTPYYSDDHVTDLAAGTAAEHLVCADLLLAGYRAFLADQNCPYDVAVTYGGNKVGRHFDDLPFTAALA